MKNIIKYILPSPIKNLIKKIYYNKRKNITFFSKFNSFQEALDYSKKTTNYLNESLDDKNINEFLKPEEIEKEKEEERFHLFVNFVKKLKIENINIFEIGGGNKPIFYFLKKYTDKNIFSYVLERDEIFEKYNKSVSQKYKNDLKYVKNVEEIKTKDFLIAYFGSSLQYLENFEEINNQIVKNNIKYVIIFDTIFSTFDYDFYSLQVNMEPSIFPIKFLSLDKLIDMFKRNNYELIFEKTENRNKFTHDKYKEELKAKYLIFERKI